MQRGQVVIAGRGGHMAMCPYKDGSGGGMVLASSGRRISMRLYKNALVMVLGGSSRMCFKHASYTTSDRPRIRPGDSALSLEL